MRTVTAARLTLDHAAAHIGDTVVYATQWGRREEGVIVAVRGPWIHVRYAGDQHAKATSADQLTLLTPCDVEHCPECHVGHVVHVSDNPMAVRDRCNRCGWDA